MYFIEKLSKKNFSLKLIIPNNIELNRLPLSRESSRTHSLPPSIVFQGNVGLNANRGDGERGQGYRKLWQAVTKVQS